MKIAKATVHSKIALIERLRMVNLKDSTILPYKQANIELMDHNPEIMIRPAQRYVLKQNIERVQQLRWALEEHGINLFNIDGFIRMRIEGEKEPIDLLPPIIELSNEADGHIYPLLNDGMHRVYYAMQCCSMIRCVVISDVQKDVPYYAYPIPGNNPWDKVEMLTSIPKGTVKKYYRIEDHKSLYRDFNSAFENVGGSRGYFDEPKKEFGGLGK